MFLRGDHPACRCGRTIELWQTTLDATAGTLRRRHCFALLGASQTNFPVTLQPDRLLHVDVSQHGVPDGALILDINLGAVGFGTAPTLYPLPLLGSDPFARLRQHRFVLFPAALDGKVAARADTLVMISVTWMKPLSDVHAWPHLIDAVNAYLGDDRLSACVSANIAVEMTLSQLTQSDRAYERQLNVLLAELVRERALPRMPEEVHGLLNRLRKFRNDIVHKGQPATPLAPGQVGEMLAAALFAFHYLRALRIGLAFVW